MIKEITVAFMIAAAFMVTGCATILTGTTDDITINSTPDGADIMIGGLKVGKTPATITVKRPGFGDKEIVLKLEGYEIRTFLLKKTFNTAAICNLAGVLGWGIDVLTGSVFKYDPTSYNVELDAIAVNIEDLPRDSFGRISLPDWDQPIRVIDKENEVSLLFY